MAKALVNRAAADAVATKLIKEKRRLTMKKIASSYTNGNDKYSGTFTVGDKVYVLSQSTVTISFVMIEAPEFQEG